MFDVGGSRIDPPEALAAVLPGQFATSPTAGQLVFLSIRADFERLSVFCIRSFPVPVRFYHDLCDS